MNNEVRLAELIAHAYTVGDFLCCEIGYYRTARLLIWRSKMCS